MINSSPRGEIVLLQWVLLGMFRFTVANSLSDLGESERYVRRRLHDSAIGESGMNDRSTLLLEHHLKELKLPSFLREYGKMAAQCAPRVWTTPSTCCGWRIRTARFPAVKSMDTFDFPAILSLNKALVMELARCEYIQRRENVVAVGNSGTGKTHIALGLGLADCQRGMSVGFTAAAALVHKFDGGQGRKAPAQPPAAAVPPQPADHRRIGLCPPVPLRCGTAL